MVVKLMKFSSPENKQLVSAALKLLSRRDMSRAEFIAKLLHAKFTQEEAETAAAWCAEEGWLNESRYAENATRRLGAKYGDKRVVHSLRQKGLDNDAISQAVSTMNESEISRARTLWLRKFGELPANVNERARQVRFLQSRGFSFEVVKKIFVSNMEEAS